MHFGFLNIMLLCSENGHVSEADVAIFRMESAGKEIYFWCARITPQFKSNLSG
jgi:hypothetical protein